MPYFPPIRDRRTGELFNLDHLDPINLEMKSDKFTKPITIRCRFSNHVFSERLSAGLVALGSEYEIEDRGVPRQFSHGRYVMSMLLPNLISLLPDRRHTPLDQNANGNTWHHQFSFDGKPASVEIIDEFLGKGRDEALKLHQALYDEKTVENEPYHIWLSIRRQDRSRNFGADIEMVVETAYLESGARRPNLLGRANFGTVVTNAFLRKPTRTRR